ncbi:site-specific integrase [Pseudomonas silesiensis]|uniref:tyrosine-type recombinase/integrase n=1 Tax=Pseudomonas silesiensis TaxID=1853130 RepID=UPI0030D48FDC
MKNVKLISGLGLPSPRLYDARTGGPIDLFNEYSAFRFEHIADRQSNNTHSAYTGRVAHLFDFAIETGIIDDQMRFDHARYIANLPLYRKYLKEGRQSKDPIIQQLAVELRQKRIISEVSAEGHITAAKDFLLFMQIQQHELYDQQRQLDPQTTERRPFLELSRVKPTRGEAMAIARNSIIGAHTGVSKVTRGTSILNNGRAKRKKKIKIKDFPAAYILELIHNIEHPLYRCIAILMAGGGLRESEAIAVERGRIDFDSKTITVNIGDVELESEEALPDRSGSKGRKTEKVFMFDPLKTLFFQSYAEYLSVRPVSDSKYAFLSESIHSYGKSLFEELKQNTVNKTINRVLKKSQEKIPTLVASQSFTCHSLRHFYGMWLRNCIYLPGRSWIGLETKEIQVLMGHANESTTEIYSRISPERLQIEIEAADRALVLLLPDHSMAEYKGMIYSELANYHFNLANNSD